MLRKAGRLMGKFSEADQNIIDARECLAESTPELEDLKKKIKKLQARKAELELKVQKNNDILVGSEDLQLQVRKYIGVFAVLLSLFSLLPSNSLFAFATLSFRFVRSSCNCCI